MDAVDAEHADAEAPDGSAVRTGRRGRDRRRHAESVASLDTLIGLDVEVIVSIEIWKETRFHCPLVVL